MRMDQKDIENIVRRRNAKLRSHGRSSGATISLGQASAETFKAVMRALAAGERNHRAS